MKKDFTIGVLGGMGTYATIHLFEQYARVFEAEKEYKVHIDDTYVGKMKTNLGGKLNLSVELEPGKQVNIRIEKQ